MNERHPQTHNTQPNYTLRRALALGGVAVVPAALLLAGCGPSEKTEAVPAPHVKELVHEALTDGPDDSEFQIISEMPQDGATSQVIESAAEQIRAEHDLLYKSGQQAATLESAKQIERTEHPILPGEEFVTWYDVKTGFFVSDLAQGEEQ